MISILPANPKTILEEELKDTPNKNINVCDPRSRASQVSSDYQAVPSRYLNIDFLNEES